MKENRIVANNGSSIVLYTTDDGNTQLEVKLEKDTVWLTQNQMAELFGIDRTSILRHIRNIYKSEELEEFSTCAKIAQVRTEGKRRIQRDIPYYSLDMIISVGYRVNSRKATVFRQGKLCVSYPAVEIHEPVCYNYGLECDSRIAWPFGYGLSYASFEYSALQMERQVAPMPTRSRSVWM